MSLAATLWAERLEAWLQTQPDVASVEASKGEASIIIRLDDGQFSEDQTELVIDLYSPDG